MNHMRPKYRKAVAMQRIRYQPYFRTIKERTDAAVSGIKSLMRQEYLKTALRVVR